MTVAWLGSPCLGQGWALLGLAWVLLVVVVVVEDAGTHLDRFQWHFKLHMLFFSLGLGISCFSCDAGNKFDL